MAYINTDDFLELFAVASAGQDEQFINTVKMVLEDTPVADVGDIVRCKDCLYATERYGHLNCIHGVSYRNSWNKPDDYCSYGVRKDKED